MVSLIKNTDITKRTNIGGNVDVSKYAYIIRESQMFVLEPLLGTKLYQKIEEDFKNNTLTGDYKKLYDDYIVSILCYDVACEFVLQHSFTVGNGGIFKHNPENGTAVDKVEVDYLANKYRLKADTFIDRMVKFLCSVKLEEYTHTQEEPYDIKPKKKSEFLGGWRI